MVGLETPVEQPEEPAKQEVEHAAQPVLLGRRGGLSSSADSAGLRVSELNAESRVENAIVKRELLVEATGDAGNEGDGNEYRRQAEGDGDDGGRNLVHRALKAASCGSVPRSSQRWTFSTTTIASSTTMPIASTRPNSDSMFSEKSISHITAKVPISDTGIARIGTSEARQLCRKTSTTSATRPTAISSVWIRSVMLSRTNGVVS